MRIIIQDHGSEPTSALLAETNAYKANSRERDRKGCSRETKISLARLTGRRQKYSRRVGGFPTCSWANGHQSFSDVSPSSLDPYPDFQ